MARAFSTSQAPIPETEPQARDWQALRGELVALLDQMEGQYARGSGAEASFARRMRDLRYQVVDADPDDRRREALRSVKRQIDRFSSERDEVASPAPAENALQDAIQQIRARTQAPAAATKPDAPAPYEELAQTIAGLTQRLGRMESGLAQGGKGSQVREIADQVGQLSQVVELLAGAVGETGQVKRLEGQIAGLADLIGKGPHVDLSQITARIDQVSANVDRLADLQVQQIQHAVREAETRPPQEAETGAAIQTIEASVRRIYDRIDALENHVGVAPAEIDRLNDMLGQIAARLGNDNSRPERLLSLVDALNGRISELEQKDAGIGALKAEIENLREAVIGALEPRFNSIEARLGDVDARLDDRAGDAVGIVQVEAQIRQLVARMDQTGEQLALLAAQHAETEGRSEADLEAIASRAANRAAEAVSRAQTPPDYEALAGRIAARTSEALGDRPLQMAQLDAFADMLASRTGAAGAAPPPALSEANLAEIEDRIGRLVEGFLKAQAPRDSSAVEAGIAQVAERLGRLEASLGRSMPADAERQAAPASLAAVAAGMSALAAEAAPTPRPNVPRPALEDAMPRNPGDEAPLREFGFPDLGPVRAALEARNGPRLPRPADAAEAPAGSAGLAAPAPKAMEGPAAPAFDRAQATLPPRPQSSFDEAVDSAFAAPATPAVSAEPASASSRNTFIEAARRSAQRQAHGKAGRGSDSAIGRALARLQTSRDAAEPAAPAPASAPVADAADSAPKKKARRGRLAGRQEPAAAAPALDEADAGAPAQEAPIAALAQALEQPRQSFISRNRRALLLGASVLAVAFMTLNLVMQRLAADTTAPDSPPAASIAAPVASPPTSAAPSVSPPSLPSATAHPAALVAPAVPTTPAPAAGASLSPVSLVTSAPAGDPKLGDAEPGPTTAAAASAIDPVTTASIAPAAVAPEPASAAPLPPALTASAPPANAAAMRPDVAGGIAPVTAQPAPSAMQSPVSVALPPDAVGPLDLRQSAANGDARSQFEVAAIYSEGRAVPQDFKQASIWYERAAAQGFAPAQYRLGNLYETGKGVDKDYEQAKLWYQRAADAGNRMAMHNLAALYAGGQFGKQDFASAANWFEQAADLGIRDSQFNLGMLYARGLGVTQNLETSYKWFALAAQDGDSGAAKARDNVARSLDAASLKAAQALVAAFKAKTVILAANYAPLGTWSAKFNPGPTIASKEIVLKVQQALARLGYDVGTPDGHAGPKTATAIKAFEQGTGMTQIGAINPRLLAVLGSEPV